MTSPNGCHITEILPVVSWSPFVEVLRPVDQHHYNKSQNIIPIRTNEKLTWTKYHYCFMLISYVQISYMYKYHICTNKLPLLHICLSSHTKLLFTCNSVEARHSQYHSSTKVNRNVGLETLWKCIFIFCLQPSFELNESLFTTHGTYAQVLCMTWWKDIAQVWHLINMLSILR